MLVTLSVHFISPTNMRVSVVWMRSCFPRSELRYSTAWALTMAFVMQSVSTSIASHQSAP